jgi:uncharacterized protein (DUF2345 family)
MLSSRSKADAHKMYRAAPLDAPVQPCDAPPAQKSTRWLEIVLVGADDKPLAGETYRVSLPDGTLHEGVLDAQGFARIEDCASEDCVVSFPNLDASTVERA